MAKTAKKAPAKKTAKKAAKKPAKKPAKKIAAPDRKIGKSPALATPYGKAPAVKDFAAAFKQIMGAPRKRSAAELFGDEPTPKFDSLVLKQMVASFHEDGMRLPELNAAAVKIGLNPQAFNLVCALTSPTAKQLREDVMTYMAVL